MDFFKKYFHPVYFRLVEYGIEMDLIIKQMDNNSVV